MLPRTDDTLPPPVFRDYETLDVSNAQTDADAVDTFLTLEGTTLGGLNNYQAGLLHCEHITLLAPDSVPVILSEELADALINVAAAQGLQLKSLTEALAKHTTLQQDPLFSQLSDVATLTGAEPTLDTLAALTLSSHKPRDCFSVAFTHPKARSLIWFGEADLRQLTQDPRLAETTAFQAGLDQLQSKNSFYEFKRHGFMTVLGVAVAAFAAVTHITEQDADQEGRFSDLQRVNGTSFYISPSNQLVTNGPLPRAPHEVTTVYNLRANTEEAITCHPLTSPWRLFDGAYQVRTKPLPAQAAIKAKTLLRAPTQN